jgi:hypothetical protein
VRITCSAGWFHDWMTTGDFERHVMPPRGPFDPRSDKDREYDKIRYVCAKCGKEELRDLEYWL